jgi:hypothetical protein
MFETARESAKKKEAQRRLWGKFAMFKGIQIPWSWWTGAERLAQWIS